MERAILTAIALFALVVWRFVFEGFQQRARLRPIPPPHRENDNLVGRCSSNLGLSCTGVGIGSGWGPGSYRIDFIQAENRAETYLHRVVALTGAMQKGNGYILDVGATRFQLRDRYVKRMPDRSDPKAGYEETCFYSAFQGMPKAEQIAAALLQLRNNPALFDKWAQKDLAFKADGQLFGRVH